MQRTKEFFVALMEVRDTQEARTVGSFTFYPDNRMGRGFGYEQQIMRHDPLKCEESFISPRCGGMRDWPNSESGMKRIAKRYAAEDSAESANRAAA
ncbi:hypothetical protein POK33_39525 [Burkholderia cenocepacia]|uniref:hypothetical protein n=1 Tax=Burkholderia cenocepacia TaxID=95486 RepID=UPI0023B8ADA3|nr:hypothetical protein [Burkholderia cenocepacia]MDF0506846.1 hypothetical protein [Burkholderia cenocepacia]